jgi:hypothetical protein
MITSRNILDILESYKTSIKHQWTKASYPVYENPSVSDYIDLNKYVKSLNFSDYKKLDSVRFVVDFLDKKVYVADGFLSLHNEMIRNFNLDPDNTLQGEALIRGGKPLIQWVKDYPIYLGSKIRDKDFLDSSEMKWLSQYFDLAILKKRGIYGKQDT